MIAVGSSVTPEQLLFLPDKVEDYRKAGVSLIWVVNEFARFVEIHTAEGLPRIATVNDVLDCGDILPGFRCPVSEIFARLPTEE